MLKQLLMVWLIFCTVGYGSAWAFDGHIDEAGEHRVAVGDVGHAPDADEEHPTCDHCCHASAHIMALCPASLGSLHAYMATGSTPYQQSIFFHSTAPPDRPPRS